MFIVINVFFNIVLETGLREQNVQYVKLKLIKLNLDFITIQSKTYNKINMIEKFKNYKNKQIIIY
jgi:hypothetical protein